MISNASPEALRGGVESFLRGRRFVGILEWNENYLFEYTVGVLLMLLCFVGFGYCMSYLLSFYYGYPGYISTVASAGALATVPLLYSYNNYYASYPYDPGTIFLFSLGIVLIVKRKLVWFYPLFLLATLNKETSLLLIALLFFHMSREGKSYRVWIHATVLLLVWAVIKLTLFFAFRDNPGSMWQLMLVKHNLRVPAEHPLGLAYVLALLLVGAFFVAYRWKERPVLVRRGLFIVLGPLFGLGLFLGYVDELRIYSEALPFVVLLAVPSFIDLLDAGAVRR